MAAFFPTQPYITTEISQNGARFVISHVGAFCCSLLRGFFKDITEMMIGFAFPNFTFDTNSLEI